MPELAERVAAAIDRAGGGKYFRPIPTNLVAPGYFDSRVDVDPETGCWIWRLTVDTGGYAQVQARGRKWSAHRVSYVLAGGQIPDGAEVDHVCHTRDLECLGGKTCRHRRCVNPDHLEPVTTRENTIRGRGPSALSASTFLEGRCARGHDLAAPGALVTQRDGRYCAVCARERHRAWYAANRDRVAEYSREHAEARLEATRRYREAHRERVRAADRARRLRKKAA